MKIIKNLILAALAAMLLFQTSITRADDEGRDHRNATVTRTKWVTAFLPPGGEIFATIAGVAGGDLGDGTVIGDDFNPVEVLADGSVRSRLSTTSLVRDTPLRCASAPCKHPIIAE